MSTIDSTPTTITATDGRQALAPKFRAEGWSQEAIDSMVMQAHRGSMIDKITCQTAGVTAV